MFTTHAREETIALGMRIAEVCVPGTIIALEGHLGAGKTTLVQGIAKGLSIDEVVTSPTFVIIAEYQGRLPLFHFDLYRLSGPDEFEELGAEELLYGNGISIIEWSERIKPLLPETCVTVSIEIINYSTRAIDISGLQI